MKNIISNNLNITKGDSITNCPNCLKEADQLFLLKYKLIGNNIHLFCNYCGIYFCITCISKEVVNMNKYPRCYRCYYRKKHPKPEPEIIKCSFIGCPNQSTLKGYCKTHYKRLYYLNKMQKKGIKKRKSFTRRKYPRPQVLNRPINKQNSFIENENFEN